MAVRVKFEIGNTAISLEVSDSPLAESLLDCSTASDVIHALAKIEAAQLAYERASAYTISCHSSNLAWHNAHTQAEELGMEHAALRALAGQPVSIEVIQKV